MTCEECGHDHGGFLRCAMTGRDCQCAGPSVETFVAEVDRLSEEAEPRAHARRHRAAVMGETNRRMRCTCRSEPSRVCRACEYRIDQAEFP